MFPKSKMEPLQMQHCFAIVDLMTDCCEMGILALLVASKHTVGKWKCTCCNVNTVYVYSLCIFYKNDFLQKSVIDVLIVVFFNGFGQFFTF